MANLRITGDLAKLVRAAARLSPARVRAALSNASRVMAEAALTEVAFGFRDQKDPYGKKWKARKKRVFKRARTKKQATADKKKEGSAILVRTGDMRNSFSVSKADASGFTIGAGVAYATFHQTGTERMVARMMLPTKAKGLPADWVDEFEGTLEDVLGKRLGG